MIPFASGKNCKLILLVGDLKVDTFVESWSVKENATIITDDVCGEDRSRLGKIVNFYDISMKSFNKNFSIVDQCVRYAEQLDLRLGPLDSAVGMQLKSNDGGTYLYECENVVLDDWDFDVSGRTDRVKTTVPLRCQYFRKV